MNKDTLSSILDRPEQITEYEVELLDEIVASYPYCQVAHLLIAKYAQDKESMLAPQKIRKAASFAYDRYALRQFLNGAMPFSSNGHTPSSLTPSEPQTSPTSEPVSKPSQREEALKEHVEPEETVQNARVELGNIPEEDLNENTALDRFNEGRLSEAVSIYKELAERHPEKKPYYYSQLSILTGDDTILNEVTADTPQLDSMSHPNPLEEEAQTESYFENISSDPETFNPPLDESPIQPNIYEEVNEGKAMGLYYDGKIEESIAMYQRLMELYPDKKEYYTVNLRTLVGEDLDKYLPSSESPLKDSSPSPQDTTQSFFDGISQEEPNPPAEEIQNTVVEPENKELGTTLNEPSTPSENASYTDTPAETKTPQPEEPLEPENTVQNEIIPEIKRDTGSFFDQIPEDPEPFKLPAKETILDPQDEPEIASLTDHDNQAEVTSEALPEQKIEETPVQEKPSKEEPPSERQATESTIPAEVDPNPEPEAESEPSALEASPEETPATPEGSQDLDEQNYLDESEAILLFNQGRSEEAIDLYQQLIERNPQKASYFKSQIQVLQDSLMNQSKEEGNTEKSDSAGKSILDEDLNERMAIQLFSQGDTEGAIQVYEKLIQAHPEKKNYFLSQIEILKS